jgi:uncharacterized protein YndB with AHSA1/START domain
VAFWKRQALIHAPVESVWALVGDPNRHPEWFPRVVAVSDLDRIEQDARFRQVTRTPVGERETTLTIEDLERLRSISMRCLDTGTHVRFVLTEAQGGTFADIEIGIDPVGLSTQLFDVAMGKRYCRRWTDEALDSLADAAASGKARA